MNSPQPEIKIFTAKELRTWLYYNKPAEGLSESVITSARAAAIIHNPYIQDNEPVAAAVFDSKAGTTPGEPAAFTAAFPDKIGDKTYHWFSTLWCHPAHQGKGYGLLAVGNLCEQFGADSCLDMWGAPETVGIFQFLGHNTTSFPEYRFEPKHIKRGNLKGEAAYMLNNLHHLTRTLKKQHAPTTTPDNYTLKYVNHIDDDTYRFIRQHGGNDLFPRTQEMLNWILTQHFKHRTPIMDITPQTNPFDDRDSRYWMGGVCVLREEQTVGFYILRNADSELSVKYLYYIPSHSDSVFLSIARHMDVLGNPSFSTRDRQLAEYISSLNRFDKETVIDVSFSYPNSFILPDTAVSQGGDGDGFA